jgi:hypothetical protein
MKREKLIELAAAAGFPDVQPENHQFVASGDLREAHEQFLVTLEAFASLVAAHEREECAKVCDGLDAMSRDPMVAFGSAEECAAAIRGRKL